MFSKNVEKLLKAIPTALVAIAFILGFVVFTPPSYADLELSPCEQDIQTITLGTQGVWDSQFDSEGHNGPVYGFVANGTGYGCTWTAEVNNYHDTLSFDDEGNSESFVLYETQVPEDVKLTNGCNAVLTINYCPLY